mgnify:CR=1 FL=1
MDIVTNQYVFQMGAKQHSDGFIELTQQLQDFTENYYILIHAVAAVLHVSLSMVLHLISFLITETWLKLHISEWRKISFFWVDSLGVFDQNRDFEFYIFC